MSSTREKDCLSSWCVAKSADCKVQDKTSLEKDATSSYIDDGFHETLCPLDMASEGQLLDTELFETLVAPLPSGCRLTVILDSCHSAGALGRLSRRHACSCPSNRKMGRPRNAGSTMACGSNGGGGGS